LASTADPGFTTNGGVVAEVDFSLQRVKPADALARFIRLRDQIAAMPGVTSVALNNMVPYINNTDTRRVVRAEEAVDTTPKAGERQGANGIYHVVTPGYFRTVGIPVLAGRDFTAAEAEIAGPLLVAIVDEKLAKRLFGDTNAIGRRIKYLQPRA